MSYSQGYGGGGASNNNAPRRPPRPTTDSVSAADLAGSHGAPLYQSSTSVRSGGASTTQQQRQPSQFFEMPDSTEFDYSSSYAPPPQRLQDQVSRMAASAGTGTAPSLGSASYQNNNNQYLSASAASVGAGASAYAAAPYRLDTNPARQNSTGDDRYYTNGSAAAAQGPAAFSGPPGGSNGAAGCAAVPRYGSPASAHAVPLPQTYSASPSHSYEAPGLGAAAGTAYSTGVNAGYGQQPPRRPMRNGSSNDDLYYGQQLPAAAAADPYYAAPPQPQQQYYQQQQQQQLYGAPLGASGPGYGAPPPQHHQQQQPMGYGSVAPVPAAPMRNNSTTTYKIVPEASVAATDPGEIGYTASNAPFAHMGASTAAGTTTASSAAPSGPGQPGYRPAGPNRLGGTMGAGSSAYLAGAFKEDKRKRKVCNTLCCASRGLGGCCCCFCIVVIVLLAAAAIFLFLVVKAPSVSFGGAQAPTDRSVMSLQGTTVIINWDFLFKVENPNFFGTSVSSLDMRGFPSKAKSGAADQIANGTKANTYIDSKATTQVLYPVSFSWDVKSQSQTEFFTSLLGACGATKVAPATGNQVSVYFKLDIGLAVLKPIGYTYPYDNTATFPCPVNLGAIPIMSNILSLAGIANGGGGGAATAGAARLVDTNTTSPAPRPAIVVPVDTAGTAWTVTDADAAKATATPSP
ncbi:hypothetical protein H9P43_004248 [Blastocladiella emersonii ATCC 22665]|nr:hypothetical protein H9P43_004248 [Blastocladiella emersonii ATCC 22665]